VRVIFTVVSDDAPVHTVNGRNGVLVLDVVWEKYKNSLQGMVSIMQGKI